MMATRWLFYVGYIYFKGDTTKMIINEFKLDTIAHIFISTYTDTQMPFVSIDLNNNF